ncbi:hypothetical protein GOP47_0027254 [Adiantum capillus-veneris]|nr:hypothetical protein GOP47_0027254 [Adiantum capillus-veneris]
MAIDPAINSLLTMLIDGVEKSSSGSLTTRSEEIFSDSSVASGLPASSLETGVSKAPVEPGNVTPKLAVEAMKKSSIKPPQNSTADNVLKPVLDSVEISSSKSAVKLGGDNVAKSAVDGVQSSLSEPSVFSGESAISRGAIDNTGNTLLRDSITNEHAHWEETIRILQCDPFLHHVNEYSNWFNNSHQIVRHQSRPCVRPQALTAVTCAFGNLMAPKLVRCLEDPNLCVRQKALLWVVELVATPHGRYQCIKLGLLKSLARRLDEQDMYIKQQVALAAGHLAGMQDACVEMSKLGMIKRLLKMIASTDDSLREASLTAVLNASFNETVRLELVHAEPTIPFIMKIAKDILCERCATLCLQILQRCLAGGTDKVAITRLLSVEAIPHLMALLKTSNEELQAASMRLLGLLSMHSDGKCQAQKVLGVEALLQFLHKENVELQTAATSALMSLTVNVEAKKDFIDGNGVPAIVPFIDCSSKILSFNTFQLATNIAENPVGRLQLQNQIRKVQSLMDTPHSEIQKKFAETTLQQLRFKHRPFTEVAQKHK